VFRMADALNSLGVEAEMWAHCPSRFTWFKPKTQVRVCTLDNAPDVDVLINSGCSTTIGTYRFKRKRVGVQWLRGHEVWARPEEKLHSLYSLDMPIWANSEWLATHVSDATKTNNAEVQYCGIPLSDFYEVFEDDDSPCIGALWSSKPMKRASIAMEVFKRLNGFSFLLFGNEPKPEGLPGNVSYIWRPDMEHKRVMYSNCDIWLATSEMEGLHIPPMEAALCGATVVAPGHPSAGVSDYCIDGLTGQTYNTVDDAVARIEFLMKKSAVREGMNKVMRKMIATKVGDVETNAQRMIARLEKLL